MRKAIVLSATAACLAGFAPDVRADVTAGPAAKAALADAQRPAPSVADIRRLGDAFSDVAERVSPSVVQIDVATGAESGPSSRWSKNDGVHRGMGSGVVYTSDGAILTNNHVVEDARSLNVRLQDGRVLPARIVGRDPATDLAVLRIDAKNLPAARFADSSRARVGEWVIAIGSPFGLGHTVTTGVLSAKGRGGVGINAVEDYLQTDASINPGNSGGPLVNLDGEVLGINTMIVSRGQGIGLAVPSFMARRVADQILKTGRVDRAWIGVGIQDLTPQLASEFKGAPGTGGALVNAVAPNGPAGRARLAPGDIIVSLSGKPILDAQEVIRQVFVRQVGEVVPVEFVRGGKRLHAKMTLASRGDPAPPPLPMEKAAPEQPTFGMALRDVPVALGGGLARVVRVAAVAPNSVADRAGLRPGDFLLEADGKESPSASQVESASKDGRLLCRVRRGSATFFAALRK